jgi:protein-S-isoprenylcysteine O-methyltransferase Ste14/GNAT superfamily N-acetyltransferase
MTYDRLFLAAAFVVFLVAFIAIMVFVRRRGHDPKGVAGGNTGTAVINTAATLLWLVVLLLYIFDARSVVWFGRIAFLDNDIAKGLGIALSTVGVLAGIAGEVALGESFRVALPRGETRLVTAGIYRHIRNPCALGADLFALATFLIAPSLLALLAVVLNLIGYYLKVQAEEEYLQRVHGAEYEVYCARTGRFLPQIRVTGDKRTGGISIVKADIADAPAIYELASHYSGATQGWAQERINDLISDSQGHYVLVAKQLDSTVGYAIARFAWGKMHIWDIAVKEDMRRRGIGKKMMSRLIDHAKSRELSEVYLEVCASNAPAVRMYQSLSFKIRFRMPGMYDGEDGLAMYLTTRRG